MSTLIAKKQGFSGGYVSVLAPNSQVDDIVQLKVGTMATEEYANSLVAEYTVVNAAATSIDFSGLDLNAHGGTYEIEMRLYGAATGIGYLFVNGDNTVANYYNEFLYSTATTVSGGREATPTVVNLTAAEANFVKISLTMLPGGHVRAIAHYLGGTPAGIVNFSRTVAKVTVVSNINQITFTSSGASSIGVGSKIIIRRKV